MVNQCHSCGQLSHVAMFTKSGFQLVKCKNCSFVFVCPSPSLKQIEDFYKDQKVFFIGQGEETFLKYLKSPKSIQKPYFKRLKRLQAYISAGRLLDIGCAGGIFLDCARLMGFKVEGIEPSDYGAEMCKQLGLDVHHGYFMETDLADGHYNLVTMYDVLEHTLKPSLEVAKVYRILKPGGIFHITLPNIDSAIARLNGRLWPMIIPPEHLNYFSPKTVRNLLEAAGFEILKVRTFNGEPQYTFIMLVKGICRCLRGIHQMQNGERMVNEELPSFSKKNLSFIRKNVRKSLIIFRPFLSLIPLFELGEGIEVIAKKPE